MKGIVVAAGLGTRLKPLSDFWPKPLVPFMGTTALMMSMRLLDKAGCTDLAVNSHHLPAKIEEFAALYQSLTGRRIHVSYEPTILGTGGLFNPLRSWLGDEELLVVNGDIVHDIDFEALIVRHRTSGAAATMALLPSAIPGEKPVYEVGGMVLDIAGDPQQSQQLPPPGAHARNYACAQILTPRFLALLPESGESHVINDAYRVALARGMPIAAFVHEGYWHDLRDPQFYWQALVDIATRRHGKRLKNYIFVEEGAVVDPKAVVEDAVIFPGAIVAAGEHVRRVLVLPNNAKVPIQMLSHKPD